MKFNIQLSPIRANESVPVITKSNSKLIINGQEFDFAFLSDGDTLPRSAINSERFAGDVKRSGDTITLTLRLSHGPDAPESVRFPQPILVEQDGPITLPGGVQNAN